MGHQTKQGLERIAFNLIQIEGNPRPEQAGNVACCTLSDEPDKVQHALRQGVYFLTEQGAPAFDAAVPNLSQLLKAEMDEREVRSTAHRMKAARFEV